MDPDDDTLTSRLVTAPDSMQIDASTGLITWNPGPDQVGQHAVEVEVSDGRGGIDTQRFTLEVTSPPPNTAPVANTGPDQTITLPDMAALTGVVTDDGLPAGGTLTVSWSQVSGPGMVRFANANATMTTATFSEPGTYVLRLSASDSELESSDEVTITLNPARVNQHPSSMPAPIKPLPSLSTR